MEHANWSCMKCGNENFDSDEFRATGGTFAQIFDVQNKKFTTVTCTRCKFTEIYQVDSSTIRDIFDFFTG